MPRELPSPPPPPTGDGGHSHAHCTFLMQRTCFLLQTKIQNLITKFFAVNKP